MTFVKQGKDNTIKNNMVSRQITPKYENIERMKLLPTLNNEDICLFVCFVFII